MDSKFVPAQFRSAVVVVVMVVVTSLAPFQARAQALSLISAKMPRIGGADERFISYNIEMAEVTGGSFWKPYHNQSSAAGEATQPPQSSTPAGMNPNMYQYRPPIDLANPQLRKLASALGPAYVRVSGTWANSVYFADSDSPPAKVPAGFSGVLTRKEWKGVIDFVHAVNGKLVTSFATSVGTRDAEGVWTPKETGDWLADGVGALPTNMLGPCPPGARRGGLEWIHVPALLLSAEDDLYGTFQNARYSAEHIPGARFVGFSTGGHLLLGHWKEASAQVAGFLSRRSAKEHPVAQ